MARPKGKGTIPPFDRVMRRTQRVGGCVEFTGYRNPSGYGWLTTAGAAHALAHRVVWEHFNGPIPDGLFVLHDCDNPPCVKLSHLHLGTRQDNSAEMVARNRQSRTPSWSKFTDDDVLAMRKLRAAGMGVREVARQYNADHSWVSRMLRYQRRANVTESKEQGWLA